MNNVRKVVVTTKGKASLTPLYREIDEAFPDIDDYVESFTVSEGVKPLFSSGEQVIEKIELRLKVNQPDGEDIEFIDRILYMIEEYGKIDPDIIIEVDE